MNTIYVSDVIDRSRLGRLQLLVITICTLCLVIDGIDVQAMGYVAPAIIKQWGIDKATLGPVFGSGLVGMAIGALCMGIVADRIGRRLVLIFSSLFLAVAMGFTSQADSVRELLIWRFITGFAMGAIIPNAVALAGEFSPARIRVTLMMITSSGFVAGGAIGGAIAALLIPAFGWRSVFLAGAIAPLALGLVMIAALPESLQFLALQRRHLDRARQWLRRIDPSLTITSETRLESREQPKQGVPFVHLFADSLGTGTVLLWVINFMNLLSVYFLANWLPVIMTDAGHAASYAVIAGTVFWIGGFIGNLVLGWFVDRRGFGPVMIFMFVVAAISVALVGQVAGSLILACAAIMATGFCVLGGQSGLNALAASYYPTSVRSTGMGWALGIGRLGSILGPVIGGELMRLHWSSAELFTAAAVPLLVALGASAIFWRSGKLPARAGAVTPSGQGLARGAKTI